MARRSLGAATNRKSKMLRAKYGRPNSKKKT